MIINLSSLNIKEQPILLLKNLSDSVISPVMSAFDISIDVQYSEISKLQFTIPKRVNGEDVPYYDDVIGKRIIEWKDVGRFILSNPEISNSGIKEVKECSAYSLEHEFTYKTLYLEDATYNFWNPAMPDETILGIIMSYMPSWTIGDVDATLIGKYRTLELQGDKIYNFMKNTLQETYGCIFEFDTLNRIVYVRDSNADASQKMVYLSTDNLIKDIDIEELSDDIVTVLDVNGADGVDIRSVNPMGENKIYNLDYFMNDKEFSQQMITKWNNWKTNFELNQQVYYNLNIEYIMQVSRKNVEKARLTDMNGVLDGFIAQRNVLLEAQASNLEYDEEELAALNAKINGQESDISEQETLIEDIEEEIAEILSSMIDIKEDTVFSNYFTDDEMIILDRYFIEDSIQDSSFVSPTVQTYSQQSSFGDYSDLTIDIQDAVVSSVIYGNKTFYSVSGGIAEIYGIPNVEDGEEIEITTAGIIRATLEHHQDDSLICSLYLEDGTVELESFTKGNLSIVGVDATVETVTDSSLYISISRDESILSNAHTYFTKDVGDYEQRLIEWDLYEFGKEQLEMIASPSYSFKLNSQNFIALNEFNAFAEQLELGGKIYLKTSRGIVKPILISASVKFGDADLELEFGSTFDISNSAFTLRDLTEKSVSTGKTVDFNKYNYNKFVDSGAETAVRNFIESALDVSKNAITSSGNQSIYWDENGFRLRKLNEDTGSFDPEQIWMLNNLIMMTDDNWQSAKLSIGKFVDDNVGSCYGICAPNIVGTMIAGENLVIESQKQDGGKAVFKVDGDGAVLYNSKFDIVKGNTHIMLDPDYGIAIGDYPLIDPETEEIDMDNVKFYTDNLGNVYFSGNLTGATGTFSGELKVGHISDDDYNFTVDNFGVITATDLRLQEVRTVIDPITGEETQEVVATTPNIVEDNQILPDYLNLKGLSIVNEDGVVTLEIDNDGNLTTRGDIVGGTIGGTTISGASISGSVIESKGVDRSGNEVVVTIDDGEIEVTGEYAYTGSVQTCNLNNYGLSWLGEDGSGSILLSPDAIDPMDSFLGIYGNNIYMQAGNNISLSTLDNSPVNINGHRIYGTWTPSVSGATISSRSGWYAMLDKVLVIGFFIQGTATTNNEVRISGLPYTPQGSITYSGGGVGFGIAATSGQSFGGWVIPSGANYITARIESVSSGHINLGTANLKSGQAITFSGTITYRIS